MARVKLIKTLLLINTFYFVFHFVGFSFQFQTIRNAFQFHSLLWPVAFWESVCSVFVQCDTRVWNARIFYNKNRLQKNRVPTNCPLSPSRRIGYVPRLKSSILTGWLHYTRNVCKVDVPTLRFHFNQWNWRHRAESSVVVRLLRGYPLYKCKNSLLFIILHRNRS